MIEFRFFYYIAFTIEKSKNPKSYETRRLKTGNKKPGSDWIPLLFFNYMLFQMQFVLRFPHQTIQLRKLSML